jgi:hypothetical protein
MTLNDHPELTSREAIAHGPQRVEQLTGGDVANAPRQLEAVARADETFGGLVCPRLPWLISSALEAPAPSASPGTGSTAIVFPPRHRGAASSESAHKQLASRSPARAAC